MWKVMQETETGETFCVHEAHSQEAAEQWVDENCCDYPESSFRVVKAGRYNHLSY